MHRAISIGVGILTLGMLQTTAIAQSRAYPPRFFRPESELIYFGKTDQWQNLELDSHSIAKKGRAREFIYYVDGKYRLAFTNCLESAWWVEGVRISSSSLAAKRMLNYICNPQANDFL